MTKLSDKELGELKAVGYIEGDLSTLPNDTSEDQRRRVEQHEADRANEAVKGVHGEKPVLHTSHTILNPNQYGYAERAAQGNPVEDKEAAKAKAETKAEPFGGKGDHDGVNGPGGSKYRKPTTDK
jgi:hypothetical protein